MVLEEQGEKLGGGGGGQRLAAVDLGDVGVVDEVEVEREGVDAVLQNWVRLGHYAISANPTASQRRAAL